ncbi:MAG: polysaccharide biosynthesis/export family protein, partial [Phycisphaeraceae bacterium]
SAQTRQVDELGMIRLPVVGTIKADGHTPSGLEKFIAKVLADKLVLRDATVTVIVQQARQNTFSILGEPGQGLTAFGTFAIPGPDFRLLDALALARGVPGRTRRLFIFRSVPLTAAVAGEVPSEPAEAPVPEEVPKEPEDLLKELFEEGIEEPMPEPMLPPEPEPQAAPPVLERGLDEPVQVPRWVNIEGKWVKVAPEVAAAPQPPGEEAVITQRVIEIPFQELFNGDMRYNIVIRPGDMIKVPARSAGFVYIGGAIRRPGAFTVPGENELTITQLVTSAGNFSPLAIPDRVDLRRRIGEDQEVIVRINLRRIFEGTQPNIFLKANDELQVGTSFVASPLAVLRNGFRFSYGFGFILDRNFGPQLYDGR